jgi:hypothetical protein
MSLGWSHAILTHYCRKSPELSLPEDGRSFNKYFMIMDEPYPLEKDILSSG